MRRRGSYCPSLASGPSLWAQTVLSAALASANLSGWLGTPGAAFTVFAVTDGGWADAFARGGVLCTVAYMRSGACGSVGDLLASTGLRHTVLSYGAEPASARVSQGPARAPPTCLRPLGCATPC